MIGGLTAILGKINPQGAVAGSVAFVLLLLGVWQGCEHRAADRDAERLEAMYQIAVEQGARWKVNAEDWKRAAQDCDRATEDLQLAALREQRVLMSELRAARAQVALLDNEVTTLRQRVHRGELPIRDLLVLVQSQ